MGKLDVLLFYLRTSKSPSFICRIILYSLFGMFNKKNVLVRRILKALNRRPILLKTDFGTFLAYPSLSWVLHPNYEPKIKDVILKNVTEFEKESDKIFIDVGAHVGRYAIEIGKNYGYSVIAFEPSPQTFKLLKKNISHSRIENKIHVFNFGLDSKNGSVSFEDDEFEGANRIVYGGERTIRIPVKRFDDLKIKNIDKTRLIVIDVEGSEYGAILGMKQMLKRSKAIDVIVEIFENSENKGAILSLMKSLDFKHRQIDSQNHLFYKRTK
jgi:FkbM family methyltransferase